MTNELEYNEMIDNLAEMYDELSIMMNFGF